MDVPKKWQVSEAAEKTLLPRGSASLLPLVLRIVSQRGISTHEALAAFLAPSFAALPDPFAMRGIDAAVERLVQAHGSGEIVCIYGDYDVDGISATALLVSFLQTCGFACRYFIPNRFDDGYGINGEAIRQIADQGVSLLVSVDCGITAIEEARLCRALGLDLIITDHHQPKAELPEACAVINPLQPGCTYPFKSLAGVGVAFNLLVALRKTLREQGHFQDAPEPDLRDWLDLVALGTIADVVPLVDLNRLYASFGLRQLSQPTRLGIQALKQVAGVDGTVSCGQVGFRLAPRLNAAGRLESAVPGVELLLGTDPSACRRIAEELDRANAERQQVERQIFDEAVALVESGGGVAGRFSIVLTSPTWHQGVVGIVASRLVERYHRPTILIALGEDGTGKGSGRSITGFHLLEAIMACASNLERFGGHRYAAGVSLKADRIEPFAADFEEAASRCLTEADLLPRLTIDAEATPVEVTLELAQELKRLEPFGMGNPEPVMMLRGMHVMDRRVVGGDHLRLRLARDGHYFNAIAFRMALRDIPPVVDVAFYPELNEWNGSTTLQLRVKDLRSPE